MNIFELFPSKYIAAEDLQGQELVVIMDRIEIEQIGDDAVQEQKPVVYFQGHRRGLVLNKTNAATIADLYSEETTHWAGKPITLFTTQVEFRGKQVRCIRVKMDAPVVQGVQVQQPLAQRQAPTTGPIQL